jgi:hypothetical protein
MRLDFAIVISDNPAIVLFSLAIIVSNHLAVVSLRFTIGFIYGRLTKPFISKLTSWW